MIQQTLFPEYESASVDLARKPSKKKNEDYEAFVCKFKPKLTTDDCYTPPAVYNTVLDWVRNNCDIDGCNIVRPFYPGGDFAAVVYGSNDVVVDNPPFSIITKIVRFYVQRGVRFFLFSPYLTCFCAGRFCTSISCGVEIVYENGANINTAFVSNLFGDVAVMTAPDLRKAIIESQKTEKFSHPKYRYPVNLLRATDIGSIALRGIDLRIPRSEVHFIKKLDSQGSKGIFGGGFLLSDRAAADRAAADRAAAAKASEAEFIEWTLSERERMIIEGMK